MEHKRVLTVDNRRRANLAKVGRKEHHDYLVEERPDGTIVLTPAAVISAEELEVLRNPDLYNSLTRKVPRSEVRRRKLPPT